MLKVMSFNIRYGRAADGINHWQQRKALVLDRIRAFAPDLLGLQECLDNEQAAFVRDNLSDYSFYGIQRGGIGESALEMAPVLWKTSTFELIEQGHFWLNEKGEAEQKGWDADFPRTCTWLTLRHHASQKDLLYLNTHFDYQPIAMLESAKQLQDWLSQHKLATIVTGDFNSEKNTPVFQQLSTSGLKDALLAPKQQGTFHNFGKLTKRENIDWILYSQHFTVIESQLDTSHQGNHYPSDHYPITAVFNWTT